MCLSNVYTKTGAGLNLILQNIQKISLEGDSIVFTDLLENDTRVRGKLTQIDLINGRVVVETETQEDN